MLLSVNKKVFSDVLRVCMRSPHSSGEERVGVEGLIKDVLVILCFMVTAEVSMGLRLNPQTPAGTISGHCGALCLWIKPQSRSFAKKGTSMSQTLPGPKTK